MKRIPAKGPVTFGIDTSYAQGWIDWRAAKKFGVKFAFSKCYEEKTDVQYLNNREGARVNGVPFGAYDFIHPSQDPVKQAQAFIQRAGLQKGDLWPMLDWERTDGEGAAEDADHVGAWVDTVESHYGVKVISYGSPAFFEALRLPASWAKRPLYVANPEASAPEVPDPWTDWTFWQRSWKGKVDGIHNVVDLDQFNGTVDDLQAFTLK